MKQAIILHGMREKGEPCSAMSNQHWVPWLQARLTCEGILTQTPELPRPESPVYEDWKRVFEPFAPDEETMLVGHSCGAGFLVRYLSEYQGNVGKVVLVAPWMDPKGELSTPFFDFDIDPGLVSRTAGVTILLSADDDPEMKATVERIENALPGVERIGFADKGHFTLSDMGSREFPELLSLLLS